MRSHVSRLRFFQYVRGSILLTCGQALHDPIISLRVEVWSYQADRYNITEILLKVALNTIKQINSSSWLSPVTFYCSACMKIEMLVVMYVCVRGIAVAQASFYDFDIRFWNCSDSLDFFFIFILFHQQIHGEFEMRNLIYFCFANKQSSNLYNKIKSFTYDCNLKCQILLHKNLLSFLDHR